MKMVVIVGVGALGSHVVQFARNLDATLRVIDFDRVEQKNVVSQFHARSSVGKSKVVGLQQTMQFVFGTKIEIVPHKLAGDNVKELLGNADLVIDCLDNAASRRVVHSFANSTGIACVHGALAANGGFGRVVWNDAFIIDEESDGAATCEDGAHLPFVALVATYLTRAAQEFLNSGRKVGFQIPPLALPITI